MNTSLAADASDARDTLPRSARLAIRRHCPACLRAGLRM